MAQQITENTQGGCACGYVRYKVTAQPCVVHCCHCLLCQRQTGSAFAVNALFWADDVSVEAGSVNEIEMESPSGKGQTIARCPKCEVAVWSNYFMGGIKQGIRFIRVGTLDNPELLPPDVHIFTTTKQPWVNLSQEKLVVDVFYDFNIVWSVENNKKRKALLAQL